MTFLMCIMKKILVHFYKTVVSMIWDSLEIIYRKKIIELKEIIV